MNWVTLTVVNCELIHSSQAVEYTIRKRNAKSLILEKACNLFSRSCVLPDKNAVLMSGKSKLTVPFRASLNGDARINRRRD